MNGTELLNCIKSLKFVYAPNLFQACVNERQLWAKRHTESPKIFKAEKWKFSPGWLTYLIDSSLPFQDSTNHQKVVDKYQTRAKQFPWNTGDSDWIFPVFQILKL